MVSDLNLLENSVARGRTSLFYQLQAWNIINGHSFVHSTTPNSHPGQWSEEASEWTRQSATAPPSEHGKPWGFPTPQAPGVFGSALGCVCFPRGVAGLGFRAL